MSIPALTAVTNAGRAIVPPKTAAPAPAAKLFQLHRFNNQLSISFGLSAFDVSGAAEATAKALVAPVI
jgi:hypothetical protein